MTLLLKAMARTTSRRKVHGYQTAGALMSGDEVCVRSDLSFWGGAVAATDGIPLRAPPYHPLGQNTGG